MMREMHAFVALGANISDRSGNPPIATCQWAIGAVSCRVGPVVARSAWYVSAPVPASDQPWFTNGVIRVATTDAPGAILEILHDIEREAGRTRRQRWEARILDLDLLAVDDQVLDQPDGPILPHPRLADRSFVVLPLAEVATDWRHPITGQSPAEMVEALPSTSKITILP